MTAEHSTLSAAIRPYRAFDRGAVITLARELQTHERSLFSRMRPTSDIGDSYVEGLLDDCQRDGGLIIVAEVADELVGYAVVNTAVREESRDEIDYEYAYVQDVAVTSRYRGTGIGRQLLTACEVIAREAGACWLRISVLAGNDRALQLYHRFGFRDHLLTLEKPMGDGE